MAATGNDPGLPSSEDNTKDEEMLKQYRFAPAHNDPYSLPRRSNDREAHRRELEEKIAQIHAVLGRLPEKGEAGKH
ncbi:uncharacterized protein BO97DRAFT_405131 [Aspergillus homomorphus CBS 101889]|uniref:Uncharacterized protein n=1 Tax=Aspergillus homomorphus (strain CBS 101889) TaxID=1450537 RepID=A0A395HYI8_ASPHC|nr:hypothetical protein BO97DRAFT_405131 [Aspergillus homomorphus CBS 101889]RAL12860.1 hypothetical protein BO97DRAFT_405131 [Aspergillus homomorphus CBS 101889]